jgi:hypothetical protein
MRSHGSEFVMHTFSLFNIMMDSDKIFSFCNLNDESKKLMKLANLIGVLILIWSKC